MKSTFRTLYRAFHSKLIEPFLLPLIFKRDPFPKPSQPNSTSSSSNPCLWFHVASVGELESLWPLILLAAKNGLGIAVTVLSPSAKNSLEKLKLSLEQIQANIIHLDYSPWEGSWTKWLQKISPTVFISAKYEAWPDLWVSLKELNIPLVIVSARARRSLKLAKLLSHAMIGATPELILLPATSEDVAPLQKLFPDAQIQVTGEPRWDRVFERIQKGNSRAQELIRKFEKFPRPWGVIGSAWAEDIILFEPTLPRLKGTLWIVPHKVDDISIQQIDGLLKTYHLNPIKTSTTDTPDIGDTSDSHTPKATTQNSTSSQSHGSLSCILVDEMGFLTELYSKTNWAFVGGGFGAGIHSTIEPAIYGIPVAGGPKGSTRFSEISQLSQTGQLTLTSSGEELEEWIQKLDQLSVNEASANEVSWKKDALTRLGASQRILDILKLKVEQQMRMRG